MAKHGKDKKLARSATGTKSQRIRERIDFFIDLRKTEDFELGELIHELKSKRKFSDTVKKGILLIVDLNKGSLEVLFEMFPWVRAKFLELVLGDVTAQFEGVLVKAALAQQQGADSEASQSASERQMAFLSAADDDPFADTVISDSVTPDSTLNNFLDSMLG